MKCLGKVWAASACISALFLIVNNQQRPGYSQEPAIAAQTGIEVEARGPIHEAFMQPDAADLVASPAVPKRPPDPINELPSEERPQGDQYQWIPGYWAWDDDRGDYLWVSGIWRVPPPGRQWVPGYWLQADGGWRWVSGYWTPTAQVSVDLLPPPPEAVEEAVPPAPDQDSVFIPGVWVYQSERHQYWWRPGHWTRQRLGWIWTPARYHWTPGGYLFVNGFWDHDLTERGIAFAPVYFDRRQIARPGWQYRPTYALAANTLVQSLFVRPGVNHYWFGDYYDPAYARRGYRPWMENRVANAYDPIYSYYRWQHKDEPRWEQETRSTYTTRRDNVAARPARTLIEQNKAGVAPTARVVVPLREAHSAKFEPLPKAHAEEIRKSADEWRRLGRERERLETKAKPAPTPPPTPTTIKPPPVPAPARIELPKTTITPPAAVRAAPPPPTHPAPAPKPPPPPRKEKEKEKEKDKK